MLIAYKSVTRAFILHLFHFNRIKAVTNGIEDIPRMHEISYKLMKTFYSYTVVLGFTELPARNKHNN